MDEILGKYYALTPKQRKSVAAKFLVILNENEETRKKSGKKSTAKFGKITKLETERDTALFNRLRAWRNKTAEEAGLDVATEAWQIMKNDPLMNAAFYKPVNEEEFVRVDGLNEDIFANYGADIISIITGKKSSDIPKKAASVSPKKGKGKPKVDSKKAGLNKVDVIDDEPDVDPDGEDAVFTAPAKLKWFL